MGKTTANGAVSFDTLTVNTINSFTSELAISTLSNGFILNNTPLQSTTSQDLVLEAPIGKDIICNKSVLPDTLEVHSLGTTDRRWKEVHTNEVPAVDTTKLFCNIETGFTLLTGPNDINSVIGLTTVENPDFATYDDGDVYCDVPYAGYYLVSYLVYWQPGTGGISGTDLTIACRLERPGFEFITPQVLITDNSDFPRRLSGNWVVYCEEPLTNIGFVAQKDGGLATLFNIKASVCALQLT